MRNLVLLLTGWLAVVVAQPGWAQTPSPNELSFRVEVRLEVVDAQVIDRKTLRAVNSLRREDFQVYEDKVRQEITSFSQDELPISIVLLFDLTDSVRPVLKPLAEGAMEALQHLKPQDEVAVMVYAASTKLIQDSTTDRALAAAAIERASRMESKEAAFFNEGIFQAAAHLARTKNPASRRVIIWLTDDVPNIPSEEIRARYGRSVDEGELHSQKDAMTELVRTDTVVCTLLKKSDVSNSEDADRSSKKVIGQMLYPPGEVYKYAQATGGQVLEASGRKLNAKLAEMIDSLRMRYSLGYHPSGNKPKGKFCAIKVKLSPEAAKLHGKVAVEAKEGYYR